LRAVERVERRRRQEIFEGRRNARASLVEAPAMARRPSAAAALAAAPRAILQRKALQSGRARCRSLASKAMLRRVKRRSIDWRAFGVKITSIVGVGQCRVRERQRQQSNPKDRFAPANGPGFFERHDQAVAEEFADRRFARQRDPHRAFLRDQRIDRLEERLAFDRDGDVIAALVFKGATPIETSVRSPRMISVALESGVPRRQAFSTNG
jgi:hypothetical protein